VRTVFERLREAGCNVQLKLYENGRHEMHQELNKDEVFADLLAYLKEIGV
jgi:alpha-beta hydrolase superfamily lysophospholipase